MEVTQSVLLLDDHQGHIRQYLRQNIAKHTVVFCSPTNCVHFSWNRFADGRSVVECFFRGIHTMRVSDNPA